MIVGHCRFSWVGFSYTGRLATDIERAKLELWNPMRMAIRFWLFEQVLLPSLDNQIDQDFVVSLLISDDLPQKYRDRIEAIVQERKTLRIHATTKIDIDEALREQISASQLDGNKEVHFRIDDDDAVSSKFIERLRHIFIRYDLAEGTVICFPRGFRSFIHNGVAKHSGFHNPYHAQGLAFVVGQKSQILPFKMQHGNAGKRLPSYVDPSFLSFNYLLHAANTRKGYNETTEEQIEILRSASSSHANRILKQDDSLMAGLPIDPVTERKFNDAGFGYTSEEFRARLERTLEPHILAEEYGFL